MTAEYLGVFLGQDTSALKRNSGYELAALDVADLRHSSLTYRCGYATFLVPRQRRRCLAEL